MSEPTYLGDGVYAKFDGYMFELYVSNGIADSRSIFLEPEVFDAFVRFRARCVGAAVETTEPWLEPVATQNASAPDAVSATDREAENDAYYIEHGVRPSEATARPDYDLSIHHNPDAVAWAAFFKATCDKLGKECDESWMVTWFSNAMMAMHDHLAARKPRTDYAPDASTYRNGLIPDGAWTECCEVPECVHPGTYVSLRCPDHRAGFSMPPTVVAVLEAAERLAEELWSDNRVDHEQEALCKAVAAMHDAEVYEEEQRHMSEPTQKRSDGHG